MGFRCEINSSLEPLFTVVSFKFSDGQARAGYRRNVVCNAGVV